MIPFGSWQPDSAAIGTKAVREAVNCLPAPAGFKPFPTLVEGTTPLDRACLGAVTIVDDDGTTFHFAGDGTKLYRLDPNGVWVNVTRTSGGPYSVGSGERWQFAASGSLVLATSYSTVPQKFDVTSATNFTALGGSPPACRYVASVRDFVMVGGIAGNEMRVQWSGLAQPEIWTPGTESSDVQDAQSGGPVRGLIGGETAYVFQQQKVTRFTFTPGNTLIFQVDEVEGGRGLVAPYSLVKIGQTAYYLSTDGLYEFSTAGGASRPIGIGKWARWILEDIRPSFEQFVIGGIDPYRNLIVWAYVSRDAVSNEPNRLLCYDWSLGEATIINVSVEAITQWLTQGVSLDALNAFGTLDTLPFSLDSPFWRGGAATLGLFTPNHKLAIASGQPMAAKWVTSDGSAETRTYVRATRPFIDASGVTVAIATRERDADPVLFETAESMEDTGEVPAHTSGNLARARIETRPLEPWTLMKGIETDRRQEGTR